MFTFRYPIENYNQTAGFGVRVAAFLIDLVAMAVFFKVLSLLTVLFKFSFSDTQQLLLFCVYVVLFTWKYGRTFGKYHTTLKVETLDGKAISFIQSLIRSLFYWALVIVPYAFAYLGLSDLNHDETTNKISKGDADLAVTLLTTVGSYFFICLLIIVDGLFIAIRKDNRALHDVIAGTRCMKN